jgi:hypothetical protein
MKTNNLIIKSEENRKIINNLITLTNVIVYDLRDTQLQAVINEKPNIPDIEKLSHRSERLLSMVEELLDTAFKNNEYIVKKLSEIYPSEYGVRSNET